MLELMITITVSLILAAVADVAMQPVFRQQQVNDAYNVTLTSLRRARDQAAADMRIYQVTFAQPAGAAGTITVTQFGAAGSPVLFTATLPLLVTYHIESGVPTSPTTAPYTPDGFGTAANFFDFGWTPAGAGGGSNVIYFYPDGTAEDAAGNINNGVVYMGIAGQLATCRAVTMWGYTGRIRGWQLYKTSGVWSWSQL